MFDRAAKPIAVHLSCDDFVDFPIEMKVDGNFAYVPPDWLPLSDGLVADLRAYQALWEHLPVPEEDLGDGEEIDNEDDDDLEFEKVWRLAKQLQVAAGSDPELARRLAQDAETRAADLDESERQALLPQLAAARELVDLVAVVAAFDLDDTDALARDLPDPMYRDRALRAAGRGGERHQP